MLKSDSAALACQSAPVFAALGDSTRLTLVIRLSDRRPYSISQLSSGMKLSRQGVTKHLRVLEDAGLVVSGREGRETQFRLQSNAMDPVRAYLETVARHWDAALSRLQDYVEVPANNIKVSGRSQKRKKL